MEISKVEKVTATLTVTLRRGPEPHQNGYSIKFISPKKTSDSDIEEVIGHMLGHLNLNLQLRKSGRTMRALLDAMDRNRQVGEELKA